MVKERLGAELWCLSHLCETREKAPSGKCDLIFTIGQTQLPIAKIVVTDPIDLFLVASSWILAIFSTYTLSIFKVP